MTNETFINNVRAELNNMPHRSCWDKGVDDYASRFADDLEEWLDGNYIELDDLRNLNRLEKILLNGASNWSHYSWSGCSLCSNYDIAEQLSTPSELKRNEHGCKQPNSHEHWLDVQARALELAYMRIRRAVNRVWTKEEKQEPQSEGVKKLSQFLGKMLLPRH